MGQCIFWSFDFLFNIKSRKIANGSFFVFSKKKFVAKNEKQEFCLIFRFSLIVISSLFDFYTWAGIKRPFLLIGQPKIKWCLHQSFFSSMRQKSSAAAVVQILKQFYCNYI